MEMDEIFKLDRKLKFGHTITSEYKGHINIYVYFDYHIEDLLVRNFHSFR